MTQSDPMQQAMSYMRHQGSKSLADLDSMIERTAADWDRCLERISEEQAQFEPEGEWCAKEVLGHVLTVSRGVNGQISDLAEGKPLRRASADESALGRQSAADESLPIEALRLKVHDLFEETRQLVRSLREDERLAQQFQHPLFGALNLKEWIAFQRIHALDHIQQIEKIKAEAAYPSG